MLIKSRGQFILFSLTTSKSPLCTRESENIHKNIGGRIHGERKPRYMSIKKIYGVGRDGKRKSDLIRSIFSFHVFKYTNLCMSDTRSLRSSTFSVTGRVSPAHFIHTESVWFYKLSDDRGDKFWQENTTPTLIYGTKHLPPFLTDWQYILDSKTTTCKPLSKGALQSTCLQWCF